MKMEAIHLTRLSVDRKIPATVAEKGDFGIKKKAKRKRKQPHCYGPNDNIFSDVDHNNVIFFPDRKVMAIDRRPTLSQHQTL